MVEPDDCDTDTGRASWRVSFSACLSINEVYNTHLDDIALLIVLRITVSKLYNHRPNQIRKLALDELVYSLIVRLFGQRWAVSDYHRQFHTLQQNVLTSSTRPSILKVHPGIPSPVWKLGWDGAVSPSATKESGR